MAEVNKKSTNDAGGKENSGKNQTFPEIGDHYLVRRSDNSLHAAEIIQIRHDETGNQELYVHYEGFDRRLDEWVGLER